MLSDEVVEKIRLAGLTKTPEDMDDEFPVGGMVHMKNQGVLMTVLAHKDDEVFCGWYDDRKVFHQLLLGANVLRPCPEHQPFALDLTISEMTLLLDSLEVARRELVDWNRTRSEEGDDPDMKAEADLHHIEEFAERIRTIVGLDSLEEDNER